MLRSYERVLAIVGCFNCRLIAPGVFLFSAVSLENSAYSAKCLLFKCRIKFDVLKRASHCGVVGVKVVTNAKSPGARCYGFVTMSSSEEATNCIDHLHKTELHGRMIFVERVNQNERTVVMDKSKGEPVVSVKTKSKSRERVEKQRLEADRMERQFLERERMRIEYERRREQERIMREREELRRQQEQLRFDQDRRPVKRPYDMDGRYTTQ
ncbi:hypothetical protein GOODEAATRI_019940 [Goodea atripinnis]|uniref:RRM domain-containing protein n=1 Tax=Goodea atripinnis TaxID=208336 RepID=A0ABV0P6B9_9TELE